MASRTYTNADLKKYSGEAVPDVVGPWRSTMQPVQGPEVDPLEDLAAAKAALMSANRMSAETDAHAINVASHRPKPGEGLVDGSGLLDAGLTVGAFVPGPVGMVSGGALAARSLYDAYEDPSAGNVAMAGLGMLPFVKPVRNMIKGAQEAKAIARMRATYGAGDMGAAFARETPYRAGGAAGRTADAALDLGGPETVLQRANATGRTMPAHSTDPRGLFSQHPEAGMDDIAARYAGGESQAAASALGDATELPSVAGRSVEELVREAAAHTKRPATYIHPADISGAKFGFESLPEISEGELARRQQRMERLKKR